MSEAHDDHSPNQEGRMNALLQAANAAQIAQWKILTLLTSAQKSEQAWEEFQPTQRILFNYLLNRGHAVLRLLALRMDFDAEILLRTFYETCAKIMLISLTPQSDRAELLSEYWTALGEVADRKMAFRAELAEAAIPGEDEDGKNSLKLLQQGSMVRNSLDLNKAARKRLEQKWSFPEILRRLDGLTQSKDAGAVSLLHVYGMGSHLAHADCRAMELFLDRMFRPPEERAALEDSHASRMISDVTQMGAYCAILVAAELDAGADDALEKVARTSEEAGEAAHAVIVQFHATQREFNQSMMARQSAQNA